MSLGIPYVQKRGLLLMIHAADSITRCEAGSLSESKDMRAYDALYMDVAEYFRSACLLDDEETKVFTTDLPPIYFQHQGN